MVIVTMDGVWTQREGHPRPGGAQPETRADAEVEIVGEQSRGQDQTSTTGSH